MLRKLFFMAVTTSLVSVANADTAYIEPSTFTPRLDQTITAETAFNDYCCQPKYPVRSDAFAIIEPDGTWREPDRIEYFANGTMLEQKIGSIGTTRITTGERLGRKGGEYVLLDGTYHMTNSDDAEPIEIPNGTPVLSSQTATVSDTYVTIGATTWNSVRVPVGRLLILPQQHPSSLHVGDAFSVQLTFDGAPLSEQTLLVTRAGQKDRAGDEGLALKSDSEGWVTIPTHAPGTHLIMTRMQAEAPQGAETDIRSYTTSLTFNVSPSAP